MTYCKASVGSQYLRRKTKVCQILEPSSLFHLAPQKLKITHPLFDSSTDQKKFDIDVRVTGSGHDWSLQVKMIAAPAVAIRYRHYNKAWIIFLVVWSFKFRLPHAVWELVSERKIFQKIYYAHFFDNYHLIVKGIQKVDAASTLWHICVGKKYNVIISGIDKKPFKFILNQWECIIPY